MMPQDTIRQGTNPSMEPVRGNPEGRKGSQRQAKESETLPLLSIGDSQIYKVNRPEIYAEDMVHTHAGSILAASLP